MAKRKPRDPVQRAQQRARATPRQRLTPDWPTLVLALLGVLLTAYLTWIAGSGGTAALCGAASDCATVQQSHWSVFLGLPVTLWGMGLYLLIALAASIGAAGLTRWKRVWMLSLLGLGISVYLTVAGLVGLDALCGWCLTSLALISAIFMITCVRRPAGAPGMAWRWWGLNSAALLVVGVGALHLVYSGVFERAEDPRLRALAEHLEVRGATFYGAFWCAGCQRQHALFGASEDRLPYLECTPAGRNGPREMACLEANIDSYPTWIINGRRYVGVQQPEELARYSRFDWEGFTPPEE